MTWLGQRQRSAAAARGPVSARLASANGGNGAGRAVQNEKLYDREGWESVIRFGTRSAPKWCSRQAEFHHILSRRSPVGLALRDERSAGRATVGGHSGGRCRRLFAAHGRGRGGHARGAARGPP